MTTESLHFHDTGYPQEMVHITDFARAIVTLIEAPDDAYAVALPSVEPIGANRGATLEP